MSEIIQDYLHNSAHKNFIRNKWVEFIQDVLTENEELGIITFPAEEMQDLILFKETGLIDWEETETGGFNITKGKVICFEKNTTIFMKLRTKLIGAVVETTEIGAYLRINHHRIMSGNQGVFPVNAINLDYDGNLSLNKVPIQEKIDLIFKFQAYHTQNFSLFITWPETETEDTADYKALLRQTIANNLEDPSATSFRDRFLENYELEELNYDNLSIIGLTKLIFRNSSNTYFKLVKHEFYVYGGNGRRKMYSILLNFEFIGNGTSQNTIYSQDVASALSEIEILQNQPEA
ncbi:hypothetical protein [uncultured Winogradskyella sp.]|uniref:hypothetical protein n=1 Tax=uncultured Winogradskyella sp. TaxID=395353 RepID=UPI0026388F86|nr:hypothetical protein [uncultured Winogradskyella sp.]